MAKVRMGTVWDRTVDVLQGRTAILAALAGIFIVLPNAVSGVASAWAQTDAGVAIAAKLVAILSSLLLFVGVLAITAVASDPAIDRAAATEIGGKRIGPALGIVIVLGVAAALLFVPAAVLIALAGARMKADGTLDASQMSGGMAAAGFLYALVAMVAGLIVSAKLAPLFAVIVNERRGLGAIAQAWRLTRGSTARLVGVILLYAILVIVLLLAVSSVTGIVARLLLGADADVAVGSIVGIAGAIVTAITTVVQTVFYARFYVAAAGASQEGVQVPA